jgi:uncharacterized repeat protein (TIGR01451 family)
VAPVLPGKVYRWPFVVRNRGNVRADAVTFAAPLSASLQFVSAQQNCSFKDTAAVCQLGSLRPGESKAGVVTAMVADKAPGGQPIDNDALVRWRSTPAQKEGRATAAFPEVKVADTADVSVVKGAPAVVQPGQRVPYQIIVANNGPTAARNVMLTSTSVPVLNLAAPDCTSSRAPGDSGQGSGQGSGPGGNGQGGGAAGSGNLADAGGNGQGAADDLGYAPAPGSAPGLVCQIGTLQPGETRKIMVNAGARAALRPGTVIQAPSQVTTSTIDADLSNNHADVRTTVGAPAVARQVVRRSAPRGLGGARGPGALPSTGAPIGELMHVVIVLLGMGLIFYRVGRRRRGHR